jgi:nicotinate phosphoribosyltransferase
LPGKKQIYRQIADGKYAKDVIALEDEKVEGIGLLELAVKEGKRVRAKPELNQIKKYCLEEVAKLPDVFKQIRVNGQYNVELAPKLNELVGKLTEQYGNGKHIFIK